MAVLASAAELRDWRVSPDAALLDMIRNERVFHFVTRAHVASLSSVNVTDDGHIVASVRPVTEGSTNDVPFIVMSVTKDTSGAVSGVGLVLVDEAFSLRRGWPLYGDE